MAQNTFQITQMIYSSPKWKICHKVKSNPQNKGVDSIFEDFKSVDLISQVKYFSDIGHFKRFYR